MNIYGMSKLTIDPQSGGQFWHLNDVLHREDGPAVIYSNGVKEWYLNGLRHRSNGPAYEFHGCKKWFHHGLLHRIDGPAIIMEAGHYWSDAYNLWYRHGKPYLQGEITCIAIAMSPLKLHPYILLWILEWSHPDIKTLNQPRLVALLEGIRNSRQKIKERIE